MDASMASHSRRPIVPRLYVFTPAEGSRSWPIGPDRLPARGKLSPGHQQEGWRRAWSSSSHPASCSQVSTRASCPRSDSRTISASRTTTGSKPGNTGTTSSKGQTDSFAGSRSPFTTRIKITGPADSRSTRSGSRPRTPRMRAGAPWSGRAIIPSAFSTLWRDDGRSSAARGRPVFYHPGHPYNVEEILERLDASRKYYSEWFFPYPWKS